MQTSGHIFIFGKKTKVSKRKVKTFMFAAILNCILIKPKGGRKVSHNFS